MTKLKAVADMTEGPRVPQGSTGKAPVRWVPTRIPSDDPWPTKAPGWFRKVVVIGKPWVEDGKDWVVVQIKAHKGEIVEIVVDAAIDFVPGGVLWGVLWRQIKRSRGIILEGDRSRVSLKPTRCDGCRRIVQGRDIEIDHIVPKSQGGLDDRSNRQLLCTSCNRLKGNRSQAWFERELKRKGWR